MLGKVGIGRGNKVPFPILKDVSGLLKPVRWQLICAEHQLLACIDAIGACKQCMLAQRGRTLPSGATHQPAKFHFRWCDLDTDRLARMQGRMTLLLGPPGGGKTTLLTTLAGKLQKSRSLKVTRACIPRPCIHKACIEITTFTHLERSMPGHEQDLAAFGVDHRGDHLQRLQAERVCAGAHSRLHIAGGHAGPLAWCAG